MGKAYLPFTTYAFDALSVGFNMFMDNIPITLTYYLLERTNDQSIVTTLTLTISVYVFCLGYLNGIGETIGIRCSVYFGQKNPAKFAQCFYRFVAIDFLLIILSITLVCCSKYALPYLNLESGLVDMIYRMTLVLLPVKVIENVNNMMKGLLISQEVFHPFLKISAVCLTVFCGTATFFIKIKRMNLDGFCIAWYCKVLVEMCCFLIAIKLNIAPEYTRIPKMSKIAKHFFKEFKFAAFICLSLYGEWMSFEANTAVIAMMGKNAYIVAWGLTSNIATYMFYFMAGMVSVLRTYVSIEIGKRNITGMYQALKCCLLNSIILVFIISSIVQFMLKYIIRIYTDDPEVLVPLLASLRIYCLTMYVDVISYSFSTILRIMKKERIQFIIAAMMGPAISIIMGYILCIKFRLGNVGVSLALALMCITDVTVSICVAKYNEKEFVKKIEYNQMDSFAD